MTKIYFDLDGTLFDLYGKENWLARLESEDATVFEGDFMPRINVEEFYSILRDLVEDLDVQIGVITWLPKSASDEYMEECTKVKKAWVRKNIPYVTEFYAQPYGTPKQYAVEKRAKRMYLFDDNTEVGEMWKTNTMRQYIKVEDGNIVEKLENLYSQLFAELCSTYEC